jgi:hypothetical protein
MISRVTIFSLLLGLMLGVGIYAWAQGRRDDCMRYPPGGRAPATEMVVSGTREIEVPCSDWWMRQPLGAQILCIADAALGVVFLVNALQDTRAWLAMRRVRRVL